MNISSILMLTIGLTAFGLFVSLLIGSFIIVMRNRRTIRNLQTRQRQWKIWNFHFQIDLFLIFSITWNMISRECVLLLRISICLWFWASFVSATYECVSSHSFRFQISIQCIRQWREKTLKRRRRRNLKDLCRCWRYWFTIGYLSYNRDNLTRMRHSQPWTINRLPTYLKNSSTRRDLTARSHLTMALNYKIESLLVFCRCRR